MSNEGQNVWRVRLGRVGLAAAFATSGAMFASALGGIASIDVGAEAASKLQQQPSVVRTHDVRYDSRGNGLSDREVERISLEAWIEDLETVVDTLGIETFPLLGISQGAAEALRYAANHPADISHLILYGAYAQGRFRRGDREAEQADLKRLARSSGGGIAYRCSLLEHSLRRLPVCAARTRA